MTELVLKQEVFAIIGAAIEVHKELGSGFLEAVYLEAMEMELTDQHIPFEPRKQLSITYKDRQMKKGYEADLICFGQIIAELKALDFLTSKESAQLLNYLKATSMRVGLLINFGSQGRLEWKRFVR
jgi:GxxExxY protein